MKNEFSSVPEIPINLIPVNVVVYRAEGDDFIFIDLNEMAEKTEKVKKDDLIGKRITDVFPGVKRFGLFDVLVRVNGSGIAEDVNLGYYEDERVKGWRKNRVGRLENGDIIAIYSDETSEKEKENKLEVLGKIVDDSINEVYIVDAKSLKFTYVNKQVEKNLGYTLEEMLDKTPVDIKPEYSMSAFSALMEPLLKGSVEYLLLETIHQRKNATTYHAEVRIQSISIDGRQQFAVFANDITERVLAEKKLKQSEEKFKTITESSLMGIFIYEDKLTYVNEAFALISGYSIEELYAMDPWSIVDKSQQEIFKKTAMRRLKGEEFSKEYNDVKLLTKSGKIKNVRVMTRTIKCDGVYSGMGAMIDISDIIETEQQLTLLAQAIEQTDALVRITDKDGIITYVNDSLVVHTGYKRVELLGKKIGMFKSGKHTKLFYKELWDTILAGHTYQGIFTNRKKDRRLYYEEETITPMMDKNREIHHFVATSQDITQRVKMEKNIQKLINIDSLTGIYNRRKINEELEIEIARVERYNSTFGLLMIDIDHFKKVNDTHGHDVGDYVLQEVCNIISGLIRGSDRFGRWGGEEFLIVSPNINKEQLLQFALKIKEAVSEYEFEYVQNLTISVGITLFGNEDTKESILKRVDEALYVSKHSGRNCVNFI
ncbi:PAS domain S-box protein [bacterium]|nr:PAS domain S-box protein [bacterium]MBU1434154.1 PAS domain S-box protein [bacterium]MBU1504249.1 PAS domain S-box protein [bacterium]